VAVKSGALLAFLAPFASIFAGIATHWLVVRNTTDPHERRHQLLGIFVFWSFVIGWAVGAQIAMKSLSQRFAWSDQTFFAAMSVFWCFYAMVGVMFTILGLRQRLAYHQRNEQTIASSRPAGMKPGTRAAMIVGMYLSFASWMIYLAWSDNDRLTAIVVAGLMSALGFWHFFHLKGKTGLAAVRISIGHSALCWAVSLGILNLRYDVWLAFRHECTLAEIHGLLPVWVVPSLTLVLVLWVVLILALTKPYRRS
jgi:hypothetical protein